MSRRTISQPARPNLRAMADRVELILADLRSKGERITPARRAVIEILLRAEGHLTADELVNRVHDTVPGVHRATIYRTMDVLQRAGAVEHTHLGHGGAVYHLAADRHAHLVCDNCGAVAQASPALLAEAEHRARAEHGFVIRAHHFALVGLCHACQSS